MILSRTENLKANIMKARLETCSDCQPVIYPEVQAFINEDLPLFHNVELTELPGKEPELVLIDEGNKEQESFRIDLFFKEEIHDLLLALGFYAKKTTDEIVPDEYKTGPYIRNGDKVVQIYEQLEDLIEEDEEEEEGRHGKKTDL